MNTIISLREYRKNKGLTQVELAKILNYSLASIAITESGKRKISPGLAVALHDLDPEYFDLGEMLSYKSRSNSGDSGK